MVRGALKKSDLKVKTFAEQGGGLTRLNFPYIKQIFEKFNLSLSREGGSGLAELFYMKKLFWLNP